MTDLRQRSTTGPILVAPGVYDPFSALIAAQAGAEAVFLSGAAVAMAQLGRPDFGLTTATELVDLTARIADRAGVPVLVDGDQGFGNAAHLQRFVRLVGRAGAAAVQIEDQLAVKPVGALRSRPLVPAAEMAGRIKAALDARPGPGLLVSARTDALSSTGLADALDRMEAYAEAGADLLFFEGVTRAEEVTAITARFSGRAPLVCNLLESGGSPFVDAAAAEEAGFRLALFPLTGLGAAAFGLRAAYEAIARDGGSAAVQGAMVDAGDLNAIVGTAETATSLARYGAIA